MRRRVLRGRIALRRAVDGGRRGEHDLHVFARRRLEHALRREDVAAQVDREDAAEAADARLPGKVEHAVEAGEVEVFLCEVDAADLEAACVLLLQRRVVVVGEAVDADDVVAVGHERFGEMRADESRRAGDDDPGWSLQHRTTLSS